ncbi:MAG: cell division ATP-binding protein FtsE [Parvibaculales bacterium]
MIRLDNVSLAYEPARPVLDNLSLDIPAGAFRFLTGASGAGKTSLLKLIFLAHMASAGRVELMGQDIAALGRKQLAAMRRHIGVVFQDFRLIEHLSVYDNVTLPLRIAGQKPAAWHQNAVELLNWVGLGDRLEALPATLSGGEKQRAAIARAVISQPRLIIADEPTGNVDPEMGERLVRLLVELNKMGTTIVIATHDRHLWENFDFPRLHLHQGRIQQMGGGL